MATDRDGTCTRTVVWRNGQPVLVDIDDTPGWQVVHTPDGTQVTVDGVDLSWQVREATVKVGPHNVPPRLQLEVAYPVTVDVQGDTDVEWLGLDRVPDSALLAEVSRRGLG